MELNNREVAVLVWTGLVLVWMCTKTELRASLWNLIKVFTTAASLLLTALGYFVWVAGLVFLAAKAGIWKSEMLNDTVIWAVASFAFLFRSEQVLSGDHFLRRKAAAALRATILVEVFVNLVVFPLPLELVLVPFVTVLTMVSAFSGLKPEFEPAAKLTNSVLGWIGFSLLAYVAISLTSDPGQISETTGFRFLLPVWLSLGVLPYIYIVALYLGYDSAFRRIKYNSADRATRRRARWALIRHCGLRAHRLGDFRGGWIIGVVEAKGDEEPGELLDRFSPGYSASEDAEAA